MAIAFTKQEFDEVRSAGEAFYKKLGDIYCPYFKEHITFNSYGIEHLVFKSRNKMRLEQDQYMRFKLLPLVPEILGLSHTIQGTQETKKFERVRINSRTETLLKPVNYYEFIAILRRNRIRIVVKQIDSGKKFFWSIIPLWGMNRKTMSRVLYDGSPEED